LEEDLDIKAPMLPVKQVASCRGWIAQTYRWVLNKGCLVSGNARIELPSDDLDDEVWRITIGDEVMAASVLEAATTEPGKGKKGG
jgi:hypothetical protein